MKTFKDIKIIGIKTINYWLMFISLIAMPQISLASNLESPSQGATLSGIGFISGWKCDATRITITINDGEPIPVSMNQNRGDLTSICGSSNHGFIMQINWALLGEGLHTVVAYDNGVEFGRSTFTVSTLGEEFVRGLTRQIVVNDFPSPGENTRFKWDQSTQHFEVLHDGGDETIGNNSPPFDRSNLESPSHGASLSGIGFISGWKCDATRITVSINDREPIPVSMNQSRGDIASICGSSNHGFIMQFNWALLGEGTHTVVVYDEGEEFGRSTFRVGTLGEEFLRGLTRQITVTDFPSPGENTKFEWNQSTQHFEVLHDEEKTDSGGYDRSFWKAYNAGLRPWIPTRWTLDLVYDERPDIETCMAGELSLVAKNRALESANQIRALHGLSPLKYSFLYDNEVQQAALIQAANQFIAHDTSPTLHYSFECNTEEGRLGSSRSNLGIYRSWTKGDPASIAVGFAESYFGALPDGTPNENVIHAVEYRRWILNPFASYFTHGLVHNSTSSIHATGPIYGAQKQFGFDREPERTPQINVDYVAFPYRTYPFNLFDHAPRWSFSVIVDKNDLVKNRGDFFYRANITVTRVSDGMQLPVYDRYTDTQSFGLPNVMTWRVGEWDYDTLYEVEITNVVLKDGSTRNYSYPVLLERGVLLPEAPPDDLIRYPDNPWSTHDDF